MTTGDSWRERRRAILGDEQAAELAAYLHAARRRNARSGSADDPVVAQEALRELSAVLDKVMKAVRE